MNGDFIIKLKRFGILVMIALFVIGVIYSTVQYIANVFKKPEPITIEEITKYMDDKNLVTDYNMFYTLESILAQLMDEFGVIADAKYTNQKVDVSDLYDILDDEYKKIYSKEDVVKRIDSFMNENFVPTSDDQFLDTANMLQKAYKMENYYILQFEDFNKEPEYILISLLGSQSRYNFNFIDKQGGN